MKSVYPVKEPHDFRAQDLVGGHQALDFVNTVTGRNGTPRDWLPDAAALAAWARKAGILTHDEARQLTAQCLAGPEAAEKALEEALALREVMYSVLDAATRGAVPSAQSLLVIERAWRTAAQELDLQWDRAAGLCAEASLKGLALVSNRIVRSFVELGQQLTSDRLRKCQGDNCAWFFFDSSKAGKRRWCDMAVCGNAAKYARVRGMRTANEVP